MKHFAFRYRDVLKLPNYRRLLLANAVNRFGDSIDMLAFSWLVYAITGSASWSALVATFNILPTVLLQPLAGPLVDRMDKKRVMVACDLARAALAAATAGLYLLGALAPWMLLAITTLVSSVEALRVPAGVSLVPLLIEPEQYETCTAANSSLSTLAVLVGTGAAGVCIALLGISGTLFVDAALIALSGLLLSRLQAGKAPAPAQALSLRTYKTDLTAGFQLIFRHRALLVLCLVGAGLNFTLCPLNSLQAPYAAQVLQGGSEVLSLLGVCMTVGQLLGSVLMPSLSAKLSFRWLLAGAGALAGGFYLALIAVAGLPAVWMYLVIGLASAVFGFVISLLNVSVGVRLMSSVEQGFLGRISGSFNAFACLAMPVGNGLTAALAARLPIPFLFIGLGVLLFLSSVGLAFCKGLEGSPRPAHQTPEA